MTFRQWLTTADHDSTAIGDLARDVKADRQRPTALRTHEDWTAYLESRGACQGAIDALEDAWGMFEAEGHAPALKSLSPHRRFAIMKRDGFRCQYCGASPSSGAVLEVDHIVPQAEGGTHEASNLITACQQCNVGKSDSLLDDEEP